MGYGRLTETAQEVTEGVTSALGYVKERVTAPISGDVEKGEGADAGDKQPSADIPDEDKPDKAISSDPETAELTGKRPQEPPLAGSTDPERCEIPQEPGLKSRRGGF